MMRLLADKLFETYVPFHFDGEDRVAAVIEVYQDYSVIQSEVDRLTRTLSISLSGIPRRTAIDTRSFRLTSSNIRMATLLDLPARLSSPEVT